MLEVLGLAGVILAVFVPIGFKLERRVTRIETKVDIWLEHNGINPKDCIREINSDKNKKAG